MSSKYPRTYHLPWSPGGTKDDRRMTSVDRLLGTEVVITEKLDGSNVCLTRDALFARSHAGPPNHPSFDWLKGEHARLRSQIAPDHSVFAEYTFAVHSIAYDELPGYLWVLGVRDDRRGDFLGWNETGRMAAELGLRPVPLIAEETFETEEELRAFTEDHGGAPGFFGQREGLVVRVCRRFGAGEFPTVIGKYVRAGHVSSEEHWTKGPVRRQTSTGSQRR